MTDPGSPPAPDTGGVLELFDEPSRWRAEIITDFRLRGAERCAAASPTPGFPQLLDSLMEALADAPGQWLDVGGGLGGVASWIERTTAHPVVVADASLASLRAAQHLFPTLDLVGSDAAALPVRDRAVSVAIVSGVISLLAEVRPLLSELRRVVGDDGRIALTDLWSAGPSTWADHPNTFWSLEELEREASEHGFQFCHVAVADLSAGWWPLAARQVSDEVTRRHAAHPAYERWRADIDHLDEVLGAGRVIPAAVLLR